MSDLYIQRIELLRDIPAVLKLREEIMVDYAERVRRLRYRVGNAGDVFSACANMWMKTCTPRCGWRRWRRRWGIPAVI